MSNELYHYGVIGMKWGVRKYQNKDGSLKKGAEDRYAKEYSKAASHLSTLYSKAEKNASKVTETKKAKAARLEFRSAKKARRADKLARKSVSPIYWDPLMRSRAELQAASAYKKARSSKLHMKAERINRNIAESSAQAEKYKKKGSAFYSAMKDTFANMPASALKSLDSNDVKRVNDIISKYSL